MLLNLSTGEYPTPKVNVPFPPTKYSSYPHAVSTMEDLLLYLCCSWTVAIALLWGAQEIREADPEIPRIMAESAVVFSVATVLSYLLLGAMLDRRLAW